MCKVYEFPKKLELPKEEGEILVMLGEAYIKALYNSITELAGYDSTRDEMEEITELVNQAFMRGMLKVIAEMEES